MAAPGMLDPTKPGQYPVILSDELMGKSSKETYTGVRYNHRPTLSSDAAPNTARLKKSAKDDSFNLGFDDQGDRYQYNGVRTTKDGNFVLIFDPARKVFVLHRVDSTFHMNITRTPTDSNVESLRNQFPHLEVKPASTPRLPKKKGADKPGPGANSSASAGPSKPPTTKAKDAKPEDTPKKKNKTVELTLPDLTLPTVSPQTTKPAPPAAEPVPEKKSKRRALSPVESEEEDDDDDGGLTIEYPDANPNAFRSASQYPPTFPAVTRRFSEFARDIERESDEDEFATTGTTSYPYGAAPAAEARYDEDEYEEEEEEDEGPVQQLPNPTRPLRTEPPVAVEPDRYTFDDDDDEDAAANDALDQEFEQLARELDKAEDEGNISDSSVSEEE